MGRHQSNRPKSRGARGSQQPIEGIAMGLGVAPVLKQNGSIVQRRVEGVELLRRQGGDQLIGGGQLQLPAQQPRLTSRPLVIEGHQLCPGLASLANRIVSPAWAASMSLENWVLAS
jgi:hypothetical protein